MNFVKKRPQINFFSYLKHQLVSKNSSETLYFDRCELFVKFQNLSLNQILDLHCSSKVPSKTFNVNKQAADMKSKQMSVKLNEHTFQSTMGIGPITQKYIYTLWLQ